MIKILLTLGLLFGTTAQAFEFEEDLTVDEAFFYSPLSSALTSAIIALWPKPELKIRIDSPGGRLDILDRVTKALEVAQSRGVVVTCFAERAYSAAMLLFARGCQVRLAAPDSKLLYHYARTIVTGYEKDVEDTLSRLRAYNDAQANYWSWLLRRDVEKVHEDMRTDRLWSGKELCSFGDFCLLRDKNTKVDATNWFAPRFGGLFFED